MKKNVCITLFCICSSVAFAQLKVTPDGKVAVGTTQTPVSDFLVGTPGYPNIRNVFEGDIVTMYVNGLGNSPYNVGYWGTALLARNTVNSLRGDIGIDCSTTNGYPLNSGRAIGIVGSGGNATPGYNCGVIGNLSGSNNGTGILGAIGNHLGVYIDGKYAGYFAGNVKVTGTINGVVVGNSDIRYKQNIKEIATVGSTGKQQATVLSNITSLQPNHTTINRFIWNRQVIRFKRLRRVCLMKNR